MRESQLESKFQGELIQQLYSLFPGCLIMKNDSAYIQGIPDLTILFRNCWAVLEVKASENSIHQPNQDHYVNMLDDMSFAAFIFPENKDIILDALQYAFRTSRPTRVLKRK